LQGLQRLFVKQSAYHEIPADSKQARLQDLCRRVELPIEGSHGSLMDQLSRHTEKGRYEWRFSRAVVSAASVVQSGVVAVSAASVVQSRVVAVSAASVVQSGAVAVSAATVVQSGVVAAVHSSA
jgi:hypothetical protein